MLSLKSSIRHILLTGSVAAMGLSGCGMMEIKETNGKLMAYRTITNEFIAQGENFEELSKHFLERFPSKTGLFPGTDLRIEATKNAI